MAVIRLKGFRGEKPGVARHLLERNDSQLALNCDLRSGAIEPVPNYTHDSDLAITGDVKTIHRYVSQSANQYWLQWGDAVTIAYPKVANNISNIAVFAGTDAPRAFDSAAVDLSGDGEYPESSYLLKVPAPAAKPDVTLGAGGSGDARDLAYVYTYIRKWVDGITVIKVDESRPSPVSDVVNALPGQVVTVDNFAAAPADSNITHIRLYRAVTGTGSTEFQYVTEFPTSTSTYNDSALDADLGEVIQSEDWDAPPDDMHGITVLPNGSMVGISGRTVLISAPFQFHAYPQKYRHQLSYEAVAVGHLGTTVVIGTEGEPYVMDGADPETMLPIPLGVTQPCLSARAMVSGERGVYYPCPDGLMWIGAGRQHDVITRGFMRPDDWLALKPDTMHAIEAEGRYIAFYKTGVDSGVTLGGGIILDVASRPGDMTRLGFYAHAAYVDRISKQVYLCRPISTVNAILQWMGGEPYARYLNYVWRSKEFRSNDPINLSAARIDADFSALLSQEEIDAREAERQEAISENQAVFDSGVSLEGALNESAVNEYAVNSSIIESVDDSFQETNALLFRLFADGREVFGATVSNNRPFRLPGGYTATRVTCEVGGAIPAREVAFGESIEELYR